jgi:hypothetical protein
MNRTHAYSLILGAIVATAALWGIRPVGVAATDCAACPAAPAASIAPGGPADPATDTGAADPDADPAPMAP